MTLSTKGWNYGDAIPDQGQLKFEGTQYKIRTHSCVDEYTLVYRYIIIFCKLNGVFHFPVAGEQAFDIPITDISQCQSNRNEGNFRS